MGALGVGGWEYKVGDIATLLRLVGSQSRWLSALCFQQILSRLLRTSLPSCVLVLKAQEAEGRSMWDATSSFK